jgi:hypothetical protein
MTEAPTRHIHRARQIGNRCICPKIRVGIVDRCSCPAVCWRKTALPHRQPAIARRQIAINLGKVWHGNPRSWPADGRADRRLHSSNSSRFALDQQLSSAPPDPPSLTDLSSTIATVTWKESAFELEPRTACRFSTLKSAGAVLSCDLSRIELELLTQDVERSGN